MEDTFKDKAFKDEMGAKVIVQRESLKGPEVKKANAMLRDIGESSNPLPKNAKYLGSAAVHIYRTDVVQQLYFINQTLLQDCHEGIASQALIDLKGTCQDFYGKRQTKRSGF